MFSGISRGIPSFGDLSWKRPAPNVTIGALSANTLSPAAGVSFGQTLEKNTNGALGSEPNLFSLGGIAVGDRILITGEASPKNGVWVVTSVGSAGSKWKLTRATDADSLAELPPGTVCFDTVVNSIWLSTNGEGGAFIQVPALVDNFDVDNGTLLFGSVDIPNGPFTVGSASPAIVAGATDVSRLVLGGETVNTTFTISGGGSATFGSKNITWTRIGSWVFFRLTFAITASGSGGTAVTVSGTGLPQVVGANRHVGERGSVSVTPLFWRFLNSGGEAQVSNIVTAAAPTTALTGAGLTNGAVYHVQGVYFTNDPY